MNKAGQGSQNEDDIKEVSCQGSYLWRCLLLFIEQVVNKAGQGSQNEDDIKEVSCQGSYLWRCLPAVCRAGSEQGGSG